MALSVVLCLVQNGSDANIFRFKLYWHNLFPKEISCLSWRLLHLVSFFHLKGAILSAAWQLWDQMTQLDHCAQMLGPVV